MFSATETRARCAFDKADDGPFDIARLDPCLKFLGRRVNSGHSSKAKSRPQRAADHWSGASSIPGDAFLALNHPARRDLAFGAVQLVEAAGGRFCLALS